MIQVERFEHISMAVLVLGPQIEIMEQLFGFRCTHQFESAEGYTGVTLRIPGRSQVHWEVIAPSTKDSFLHRFLAGPYGPGLHHVAVEVTSTAQAERAIRAEQAAPWTVTDTGEDPDDEQPAPETIYLHPRTGGRGFLWQLNQKQTSAEAAEAPSPEGMSGWDDAEEVLEEPAAPHANPPDAPTGVDAADTLGIVAVNHLGHATPDRHDLAGWYERLFGCETVWESPGDGATAGFRTRVVEPPGRQFRFEAIEPSGPESFLGRFVEQRGESMHHVTFEVGDWQRALAACRAHQVPLFGERDGMRHDARWNEAFIHPRHTGGVLVQLFWEEQPGTWV